MTRFLILLLLWCIANSLFSQNLNIECAPLKHQSFISVYDGRNFWGNKQYYKKFEVPPWVAMGCWRGYFAAAGGKTYFVTTPKNMIDGTTKGSCGQPNVTTPQRTNMSFNIEDAGKTYVFGPNSSKVHRRNYGGIYSSHILTIDGNLITLGFVHGENGTNWTSEKHNNIRDFSGSNIWEDYYSFVSVAWVGNHAGNNWGHEYFNDQGPIVWPSAGYLKDATKTSNTFRPYVGGTRQSYGPRHPSSIVHNGYVYVFYYDHNLPNSGHEGGIKVARARLSDSKNYTKYRVYHNGNWVPSLPSGLTKYNQMEYIQTKGPESTVIVGGYESWRFSVAKVKGTNYFIGVRESGLNGTYKLSLHKSYDLINWGPEKNIIVNNGSWEDNQSHYPIFLNKNGTSNTEIDKDQFFILMGYTDQPFWQNIRRFEMSLNCPPPPPPPPPPGGGGRDCLAVKNSINPSEQTIQPIDECYKLYPNPSSGTLKIYSGTSLEAEVIFYNNLGKKIMTQNISIGENIINLPDHISTGYIHYQIISKIGSELDITTGRIFIEK